MDVDEGTWDAAESIVSDILISESCVENIIAKLDSYETLSSEEKYDQPQPLTVVNQTPEKKYNHLEPLSMIIPLQKPDQPIYQDKEHVDQTLSSPRGSVIVVEDYLPDLSHEKSYQVLQDMNTEEATWDTASIVSDILISESSVENIISKLNRYEMPTSEEKSDQPKPLTVVNQKPVQPIYQDKESVNRASPSPLKIVENYSQNLSQDSSQSTLPPVDSQQSTLPLVDSQQSTLPLVDSQQSTLPLVDSQQSTLPLVDSQQSTLPLVDSQQSTLPLVDSQQSTLPLVDSQQSTLPLVDSQQSTLPPVDSQQSTLPPVDSQQSTLPPVDSQQSSSGFPLSLGDSFKQDVPVSGNRVRKPLNLQQMINQMSGPSLMKQIKSIHNCLNLSLKKGKVPNQTDQVHLGNAKQMLFSLKQRQAVSCNSLRDNFKRQTPSDKSRQALKKKMNLLEKWQHKLLLLFQQHNTITKKLKTLNSNCRKQTQIEVKKQSLSSSQISDLLLFPTRTDKIPSNIVTSFDFDDTQSESASTVYSLGSLAWSQKIKTKSPNVLVCELNTLSKTPLLNNKSSICSGWLDENSTKTSNDLSLKSSDIPSTNMSSGSTLKSSAIPSTNMSNNLSLKPFAIPSTNTSNDFDPKPSAIPSTDTSNNLSLKPTAIPSTNMSNGSTLKPSAIPSTNMSNDFSPKPSAIPSTGMSNDFSLKPSAIPSTGMSNGSILKPSAIPLTNMSNNLSPKPSAIPSTDMLNDFSRKPSAIPSTDMSNGSILKPSAIPLTNMSNDFSPKPSAKPLTNMSNDFSLKPSAIPSTNMSNDSTLKLSSKPSINMSNEFSLTPSSLPSNNMSNDPPLKPLPKKLKNCQKSTAQSQKKKPKTPNLLFSEPKLNAWNGVKDDHNYSTLPQCQKTKYESTKTPNEKMNHSINNFSHKPNHNIPSQAPLPNNESPLHPNWLNENSTNISNNFSLKPLPKTLSAAQQFTIIPSTNMSNDSSLKPLPKMLTNCQQFTIIPIGTRADFAQGQLVRNFFPSVVTSAHQGVQNSGPASQGSQNRPAHSRNDLLCTSTNISTITANRAASLKLGEMKESFESNSVLKSKNGPTIESDLGVWSKKCQANLDNSSSQIATSLTHLTLIEDQELMPLNSILPSCQNTDSFGSINFPKFLWEGFHKWP